MKRLRFKAGGRFSTFSVGQIFWRDGDWKDISDSMALQLIGDYPTNFEIIKPEATAKSKAAEKSARGDSNKSMTSDKDK
jgi:hypothetical protein